MNATVPGKALCKHEDFQSMFRAYDIRGTVADGALDNRAATLIGLAVGSELRARGRQSVIIARDGRHSSAGLARALTSGLTTSGCDVIDVGMVPTPLLYFATKILSVDSGVMITGSHNPPDQNGFKIVLGGQTLFGEDIQALYQRIITDDFARGNGQVTAAEISRVYEDALLRRLQPARPLKVVVDCGNGVAGATVPTLLGKLGHEVHSLYCTVDGNFPHHHPDPAEPRNLEDLIRSVIDHRADLGLAFDGDGDRLGVVSGDGTIIWPDRLLMLYAIELLSRVPRSMVIYDVKCTNNLPQVISDHGGIPVMSRTGHSYIKEQMRATGAPLAGEMSGHLFFADGWYGFDDAIYAAARLLDILSRDCRSATEVFNALADNYATPELRVAIREEDKGAVMMELMADPRLARGNRTTIDGLRVDLGYGWGLVRPSNTTANLILRFEANSAANLERIKGIFADALRRAGITAGIAFAPCRDSDKECGHEPAH